MLTLAQVEAMAPDQSALAAASKLLKPSAWPLLARDAATSVVWGEAQGSGSAPYRLMFDPADRGHKCSCPSRKFPCKHVLAMMWQFAEHPDRFVVGEPAPWVSEWLSRRRPGTGRPTGKPADADAPAPSMAALAPAEDPQADPAAEAQAAQRRARAEAAREASVSMGLEALDTWIGDQLNTGLASFAQRAQAACRLASQRLVDAKAPGLAARLDALPGGLLGRPEPLRPDFLLAELGRLHLTASAWRRREGLDPALVQDLRRTIGWTVRREDALNDPAALRVSGEWLVAGTRTVIQPDRLRRTETWLSAAKVGGEVGGEGPRTAVLLDFTPVQAGAGEAIPAGERFAAELAFYPSTAPLRALVATRGPATATRAAPEGGPSLGEALAAHQARLAALPWLGDDLLLAGRARVVEARDGLWAVDPDTGAGLRLPAEQARAATPLLGLDLTGLAGVWDGQILALLSAATPHGPWFAET
jgi:hypothetical protein